MKKRSAEKKRIIVDSEGVLHTVSEALYLEIDQAVRNGAYVSYLTHPDKLIRFLADLRIKSIRGR